MPFGLSNAPATFQALMNDVLRPYLRKFVLVFFDDILIYSTSWAEHLRHLSIVLNALRAHSLHLERSKCSFGTTVVAYLGHVISEGGVAMDAEKVTAVAAWPQPRSARGLRGFLGLAGYYRKFIREFGLIAAPLTRLLRRDAFTWDDDVEAAFEALKGALTSGPVVQMPDFSKPFVVDCDALGAGFGAVLHQTAGPLAYFSKSFAARHLKLAAYERELIGLVQAVRHWRPYLWGRHFRVRTDHYSLKFLLDQHLSTVPQHQWISKLFGFDFSMEYRPGRLNTVADALSRRDAEVALSSAGTAGAALYALSSPSFTLLDTVRAATATTARDSSASSSSRTASWLPHGVSVRASFYTGPAYLCRTMVTYATRLFAWCTRSPMRVSKRPSIACAPTSTSHMIGRWSGTGFGRVPRANATRPRHCSQRGCCSRSRCRPRCGRTSRWISSRDCPRSTGSRSSSPSSTASRSTPTSSR
jgi:hypothetical protein